MDGMEYYHQTLAGHLLAMIVFGGGVLLNAFMLPSFKQRDAASDRQKSELRRLRAWTLYGTSPALCLVWLFGAMLAVSAGWFGALWLQIKLCLVVSLTFLHCVQVYWIQQLQRGRQPKGISYWTALLVAILLVSIAILAGAKPV